MKRSSERQITKDDPSNLNDDSAADDLREGIPQASAETLAKRKILRGRRSGASAASRENPPAPAAVKASPFAGAFGASSPSDATEPSKTGNGGDKAAANETLGDVADSEPTETEAARADAPLSRSAEAPDKAPTSTADAAKGSEDKAPDSDTTGKGSAAPTAKAPEPEAAEPDAAEPGTTEPEAAEPGVAEPETTKPETTEPEATEPEAIGPKPAEADAKSTVPPTSELGNAKPRENGSESTKEPERSEASSVGNSGHKTTHQSNPAEETASEPSVKGNAPTQYSFGNIGGAVTSFKEAAAGSSGFTFASAVTGGATKPLAVVPPPDTADQKFEEQDTVTGEEDETTLYKARCRLYSMNDKKWTERGVGFIKLNVLKSDESKARLLLRTETTYRLVLNTPVIREPDMMPSERTVRFMAQDVGKDGLTIYMARFASPAVVDEFIDKVRSIQVSKAT